MRHLGKDLDQLPDGQRIRIGEVERLSIQPVQVCDVIHRLTK